MPISREPKWDFTPREPRMLELYYAGKSIPQIHDDILSDTFKPSPRSVYNWFHQKGLSTGHDRRWDKFKDGPSAKTEDCGVLVPSKYSPASLSEETRPPLPSPITGRNGSYGPDIHRPGISEAHSEISVGTSFLSKTVLGGDNITDHDVVRIAADLRLPTFISQSPGRLVTEESGTYRNEKHKKRSKMSPEEGNEMLTKNLSKFGLFSGTQHGGGRTRHPDRIKTSTNSPSFRSKTLLGKLRPGSSLISSSQRTRTSQSSTLPDNDSGYASGPGTPPTLPYRVSLISGHESLSEFRGLYRVACHKFHEPGHPHSYTGFKSCSACGFSAIHGLAWVAKYLEIAEFEQKLMAYDLYDIKALDAAGNSALHYAAISGISYIHLKALIKAGAPLDMQNTAKQNFLHCLRPCEAANNSGIIDCFQSGLVALLQSVEPEKLLSQQDNDGQTVLHMLASQIIEPKLRDHTFKIFSKRGHPAGVINRFGKSAKDICAPKYKQKQTMFAVDTLNSINGQSRDVEITEESEWVRDQLRQMRDQNIIVDSHDNPRYINKETKDTVLHALSRVNTNSHGNMQDLRQSVARGADLNRHNRDGFHPLAAFICNQRFRDSSESGAVMSKYIDILLWKGKRRGDVNDINDINDINVDMMTSAGRTALYEAAVHAQIDTVRSLIDAGANVNARLNNDPCGLSVLRATYLARNEAVVAEDRARVEFFKEVISHLELADAVEHPTSWQARSCNWPPFCQR